MSLQPLWYALQVYAGFEKKVVQSIKERAEKKGLMDCFVELLVPTEEVVEMKRGQKVNVERNYFPGYVFVKMYLTDEAWHLVRETPKVATFLGDKGKPQPVSEAEIGRILKQVRESVEKPRSILTYLVGEQVRVIDGPFTSFSGMVEAVDSEKTRLKVSVMIFGRPTPVDLDFTQVEKV